MQQIVFVLPSFAGGGAERVVIGLANGLNRDRYEPVMIVLENKGPLASDLDEVSRSFLSSGRACVRRLHHCGEFSKRCGRRL